MKKFFVVLIAISLVLAFSATAFAADTEIATFSDIADQSDAAQVAIMKLAALGVLEGDNGLGGAYDPADTLTRAEFAKIAVYLAGKEGSVNALANVSSSFKDVAKGEWYTGYVNVAYQNGMIKGYTDGTFRPNATITYAEASTILLRSIGYDDHLSGGWPSNYLGKGESIGLFDDVDQVNASAVTRADMAILGSNSLGLSVVRYIENEIAQGLGQIWYEGTVDADGYSTVYYYTNDEAKYAITMLDRAFDAYQLDEVMFDVAPENDYPEAYGWDYSDFEEGQLTFQFEDLNEENNFGLTQYIDYYYEYEVADNYYIYNSGLGELSGMLANVIYNEDDEVIFVEVTSSCEKISEFEVGSYNHDTHSTITADDSKIKYTANKVAQYYTEYFDDDERYMDGSYGVVYLDADGRWYGIRDYDDYESYAYGYVDEVDDEYITFNADNSDLEDIAIDEDLSDYDDFILYKDGELIDATDLVEGDVLYATELANDTDFYIVLSAQTGNLTNSNSTDGYKIAGTYYNVVDNSSYSEDGGANFVYLDYNQIDKDAFGTVAYTPAYAFNTLACVLADYEDTTVYGVVTGVSYTSSWDEGINGTAYDFTAVTIFNADGEKVTYDFEDDFADDYAQNDFRKGDMVELTIDENGEVTASAEAVDFTTVKAYAANAYEVTADDDTDRLIWTDDTKKTFKLTADTEIFLVSSDEGAYDEVKIASVSSILADDFNCRYIYVYDNDGNTANTIYILDNDEAASEITPCDFITDYEQDADGYYFTTIDDVKIYVEDGKAYNASVTLDAFYTYETSGGEIVNGSLEMVVSAAGLGALSPAEATALVDSIIEDDTAVVVTDACTAAGSGTITVGGVAYNVDSNTFMYAYKNQLASGNNDAGEVTRLANFAGAQQVVIIYDSYANDALYIFAY